jgi:Fic family protein
LETIREDLEALREDTATSEDILDVKSRLRELEGIGSKFTDTEWLVLKSLMDSEGYVSYSSIAEDVDTSKNNARAVLNNLKDKVNLDHKTEGRKKLYSMPQSTQKEIFSQTS